MPSPPSGGSGSSDRWCNRARPRCPDIGRIGWHRTAAAGCRPPERSGGRGSHFLVTSRCDRSSIPALGVNLIAQCNDFANQSAELRLSPHIVAGHPVFVPVVNAPRPTRRMTSNAFYSYRRGSRLPCGRSAPDPRKGLCSFSILWTAAGLVVASVTGDSFF